MNMDERNEQGKGYQNFRMGLDLGMGGFYMVLGITLITLRYFGNFEFNVTYATILGALMIGYGCFRLYLGFKGFKNRKRRTV
jgi:hypothetical protein